MNKYASIIMPAVSFALYAKAFDSQKQQTPLDRSLTSIFVKNLPVAFCEEKITVPSFANLSDPSTLKKYISPSYQNPTHQKALFAIIRDLYESAPRHVSIDYGCAFPAHPEILAYAMEHVKGEIALEIGAADGLNAIMLAFAGAKTVYVNDITQKEMTKFEMRKKTLPSDLQSKLVSAPGNGSDVLKKNPDLEGKVGLILCRNVIHFQDDKEQLRLLGEVKKLLKPGGIAIFSTNSANFPLVKDRDKEISRYVITQLVIYPYGQSSHIPYFLEAAEAPLEMKAGDYENITVCSDLGSVLGCDLEAFQKSLRFVKEGKISESLEVVKDVSKETDIKKVMVLRAFTRAYSEQSLANLFRKNGFEVEQTLSAQPNGHLMKNPKEISQQVIAIVKKSS